ncbi:ABC transporter permease [Brachybacterium sp. AOP25-B2-12]|uniref:ABC transporter permease n=1 Tax=Brachybacterium sp. AOP25-B2-12 TaxID=3457710 RepID=UPI004033894C
MTGILASLVEAFGELRVNKGRIMLSLIGVAFSVFALTAVLGGGGMMSAALTQSIEKYGGRPTILNVWPTSTETDVPTQDSDVLETFDALGLTERTRMRDTTLHIQTGSGVVDRRMVAVDPAYGDMYRVVPVAGRWFADSDQDRLAPAIVVDETIYAELGSPDLGSEAIEVVGDGGVAASAVVIGVVPSSDSNPPTIYAPTQALDQFPAGSVPGQDGTSAQYLVWVQPDQADAVMSALTERFGSDYTVGVSSMQIDDFKYLAYGIIGVAVVILLLGALGLVNIALVTIRYRVREIGIRRSYGATGLRIFFGVLMESVVATVVAGAIGIGGAIALVKAPFVTNFFLSLGLVQVPPFPVTAAVVGLVAAIVVGVLAGALPALIATRIKVIDAIRS